MADSQRMPGSGHQIDRRLLLKRAGLAGAAAWAAPALTTTSAAYAVGSPPPDGTPGGDPGGDPTKGSIVGRIVDAVTLAPLTGVQILPSRGSTTVLATTDTEGRYRIDGLAPGTSALFVPLVTRNGTSYNNRFVEVTVLGGVETRVNHYLPPNLSDHFVVVTWREGDLDFFFDVPTRDGSRQLVQGPAGTTYDTYVRFAAKGPGLDGEQIAVIRLGLDNAFGEYQLYARRAGGGAVATTGATVDLYVSFIHLGRREAAQAAGPADSAYWDLARATHRSSGGGGTAISLVNALLAAPPPAPLPLRVLLFDSVTLSPAGTGSVGPAAFTVPLGVSSAQLLRDGVPMNVIGSRVDVTIDGVTTLHFGHGVGIGPRTVSPGEHSISLRFDTAGRTSSLGPISLLFTY
ncbi:carboxypeptidase regulatory-like domain-containing protein [Motilibacter deserti]|uniref:Carboxypeptidase regulatory-like domain-containing protein n=1 Tax=Motilibacter deserti TaxID=2714956 RepID=A0ABX0H390_9ACTN|nr:carboxypeptidase regulatory-like domain-containing protein [Motilibacter deserti]NHC16259.1 carboxypeptidase regulatory-like domain-containing protein [Motilibacter deserti]